MPEIKQLYNQTLEHQNRHRSGIHPYKHYEFLQLIVSGNQPKRILELGTGIGLTAVAMSLACPLATIDSIDNASFNLELAKEKAKDYGVSERINLIEGTFAEILPTLKSDYDLVFFDGFRPEIKEFLTYETKLKTNGIMYCVNIWTPRKSPILVRMKDKNLYKYLHHFEDTAVGVKGF